MINQIEIEMFNEMSNTMNKAVDHINSPWIEFKLFGSSIEGMAYSPIYEVEEIGIRDLMAGER